MQSVTFAPFCAGVPYPRSLFICLLTHAFRTPHSAFQMMALLELPFQNSFRLIEFIHGHSSVCSTGDAGKASQEVGAPLMGAAMQRGLALLSYCPSPSVFEDEYRAIASLLRESRSAAWQSWKAALGRWLECTSATVDAEGVASLFTTIDQVLRILEGTADLRWETCGILLRSSSVPLIEAILGCLDTTETVEYLAQHPQKQGLLLEWLRRLCTVSSCASTQDTHGIASHL